MNIQDALNLYKGEQWTQQEIFNTAIYEDDFDTALDTVDRLAYAKLLMNRKTHDHGIELNIRDQKDLVEHLWQQWRAIWIQD